MLTDEVWLYVPNSSEWEDIKLFDSQSAVLKYALEGIALKLNRKIERAENDVVYADIGSFHIECACRTDAVTGHFAFDHDRTLVLDVYAVDLTDVHSAHVSVMSALVDPSKYMTLFIPLASIVNELD